VYGVVLDHNIDTMTVDVTLMPQIVEGKKKEMGEKPSKKKKVGHYGILKYNFENTQCRPA
jgi:hypothetical protein